ncbi:MAG: hypothetical protein AAF821_04070 [Cyanobacteria bacterium P01_D01_bin.156]
MAASPSRLPLDRAVRYAVSDALASVKSHLYDLEYNQRRSNHELASWNNYLSELRALHQLLLNLPSLETAEWLTDAQADCAPTFTPFIHSLGDARTNIRRIHNWLLTLPKDALADADSDSVVLEQQQYYIYQINCALSQLQLLPRPGSDDWYERYQPAMQKPLSEAKLSTLVPAAV